MSTVSVNGRAIRKSLADQIDRLDSILDGLADGLNEAVATAAVGSLKEIVVAAVQQAVRAALVEILSNAEVQKRLAGQATEKQTASQKLLRTAQNARRCWKWLVTTAKAMWAKLTATTATKGATVKANARSLVTTASQKVQQFRAQLVLRVRVGWTRTIGLLALVRHFQVQLLGALGIGLAIGLVCYLGGRELASVGCGLAGFMGSLAMGIVERLKRLAAFLTDCGW